MKIAIIAVNYNGKQDTLEFLESLKKLKTEDCKLKTIVVDNASSDGSVSAIHQKFPDVDILQSGQNLGFSGGYNKGLEYAQVWGAGYFLLVNNDCLIKEPDLIPKLVKTAKINPKIGLVSPKIYFAPGFEFCKDKYKEADLGNVIWYSGGKFDWDNIGSFHRGIDETDQGQFDTVEETEIISGACVLIKKQVLDKIGLFDEKYFLYFEDSDLVKRSKNAGFKTYYCGETSIYHKVSQSTGLGSDLTDYYHSRNKLIFGMEYGKLRTKFALFRESIKLFLFGRPAQRQGILDFYLGLRGGANVSHPEGGYQLKLSVCIVNYNTPDLTKKLLQSIFKKDSGFDPKTMEVIVLDNGSIAPCRELIKEFLPEIKYLQNQENEGFSKGYNKTIKFSLGQYVLMLNSDIEVTKNSILEILKWADYYKEEAVLGGKLLFPDKSDQDSAFHLPTLTGAFKEYFLGRKGSYFMFLPKTQNPEKVEGLAMACLLIPRKILDKVGLLDEGTFIFFEDIEYARRLKKFRVSTYFVPQARFLHFHGGSTKRIGQVKANEHLIQAAKYYHGRFYYTLLSFVLRVGQKLGRVITPTTNWNS